jgi:hypothetical protein
MQIEFQHKVTTTTIHSASGLVITGDDAFVVSDDGPFIYELSVHDLSEVKRIPIEGFDTSLQQISKPIKPDYEAMTEGSYEGKKYVMIFSSGGISPFRDSLILFNPNSPEEQKKLSLASLYQQLKTSGSYNENELNIEAAVTVKERIFLFERSKNKIFEVDITTMKLLASHDIQLPIHAGVPVRFSGACLMKNGSILFSASVEEAPNMIDDGNILGSYFGILEMTSDSFLLRDIMPVTDKNNVTIKEKIESLDILPDGTIIAVADNDNGTSTLFKFKLKE